MANELSYIIYVSQESRPLSSQDLEDILNASRRNNDDHQISGMLLYVEGNFFQVLEGPEERVEKLFQTISSDQRHKNSTIVAKGSLDKRMFEGWDMRFNSVSESEFAELTGVNKFRNWFSIKPKTPDNPAWMFLKKFGDKTFPSEGWWKA